MLKNIKLFSTDSDRTTYESSASYETPYVSKVAADNRVHYNKLIRIITFRVNDYEFQAEEGMTWGEFVNSSYNPGNFRIESGGAVIIDNLYVYYTPQPYVMSTAYSTDIISSTIEYWSE